MLELPSPVGESYFSIKKVNAENYNINVSVPCRGILFFNRYILFASESDYIVSVPCRGILFFNFKSTSKGYSKSA